MSRQKRAEKKPVRSQRRLNFHLKEKEPKFTVKEGRFIRLPEELDQWLCDHYAGEGYSSPNEFIIGLVREARRNHLRAAA
jgi:hypothetical protein